MRPYSKILLCLLGLLDLYAQAQPSPKETRPTTTGAELIGGDFNLTNHHGKKVSLQTYRGKYLLVFFGFTHCPSVCPLGLQTMSAVTKRLGKLANEIQILFITVDPERDDEKRLKSFVEKFDANIIGLRGSPTSTQEITDRYRAYFKKINVSADDPETNYLMDHGSVIYLMSKEGKYLAHFASENGVNSIKEIVLGIIQPR